MAELLRLRGSHENIHNEYTDMETSAESSSSIGTLLHPRYAKPILLSNGISAVITLPGWTIVISYLDVILSRTGWNEDLSTPRMLLGVSQFVAAIVSIYVVAVTGRRGILLLSLSIIVFSSATLGCVIYFGHMLNNSTYKWLSWTLLFLYIVAFDIGAGPVSTLVRSEVLPTRVRAPATSFVFSLTRVIEFIMTQTYPYILEVIQARSHGGARGGWAPPGKIWAPPSRPRLPALTFYRYRYWGLFPPLEFCQPPLLTIPGYGAEVIHDYGVFWVFAALSLICFLFIYFFLMETKDKSLEEIEMGFL